VSDRLTFRLINARVRQNALEAVRTAPEGYRVSVSPQKRSDIQNDKMWALLGDVADARPEGRNWTPETWKAAFMHYLGHQVRFCEGLEGTGPFPLGFHSSRLSVGEMSDLITCIIKYGDEHKVKWTHDELEWA
jgi:hypothetical protein